MSKEPKVRERAPKARHYEIVLAGLEERLSMVESSNGTDGFPVHAARIRELLAELRRSLKKNGTDIEGAA